MNIQCSKLESGVFPFESAKSLGKNFIRKIHVSRFSVEHVEKKRGLLEHPILREEYLRIRMFDPFRIDQPTQILKKTLSLLNLSETFHTAGPVKSITNFPPKMFIQSRTSNSTFSCINRANRPNIPTPSSPLLVSIGIS